LRKSPSKVFQNLINEIISEDGCRDFKEIFIELDSLNKNKFKKIILENKLSSYFIDFIGKNNLLYLFDKTFLENCEYQKKRFQINSLNIIREAQQLHKVFASEGLNPIYLKGMAFQREYDDIALRPFVDIDILFDKSELLKVYETLHEKNFLAKTEKKYLNGKNIEDFCSKFHHIHLITKNNISIELHHRLTETRFFLECPIVKNFYKGARNEDFFGEKIRIPSIENLIVHQLCHFFFSDFKGLIRTLSDIKIITRNHKVNFYEILSRIENKKIRKSLILSLELIHDSNIKIENLNQIRSVYRNDYPNKQIISEAREKLFDTRKKLRVENLFDNISKSDEAFTVLARKIFPERNSLIYEYKIPKPNNLIIFKAYIRHFFKQLFKLKDLVFLFKNTYKDGDNLKYTNATYLWFNRN